MLKLSFFGGAQEVTGANYLLEKDGKKVLIDCGFFQGSKTCESRNWLPFPFNPSEVEALFITHGHLDHIGRVPKLAREGFKGRIFSTFPTRDFSALMLEDSLGILTKEAKRDKRKPFYSQSDINLAMDLWEGVEYNKEIKIGNFKVTFREAGHILGSAMIEIEAEGKRILFSGDLGNPPVPLLRPPYQPQDLDYLIIESTYGNRLHEDKKERKLKLERTIEDTINKGGVLMIPAFSLERTQELLFELNDLVEHGRVPKTPIFLDSPLAIKATEIYKKFEQYYNKEAKYIINSGDDIFKFPGLKFTLTTAESKQIKEIDPPKVIIAGSGMSTGGRIIHHELNYLPDPKSTLLIIGHQAPGSLGRILEEGAREVKILGEDVFVRAKIVNIKGYSAHPDRQGLFQFVKRISFYKKPKKIFVVQGEPQAALFFSQRIKDYLGIEALAPEQNMKFDLN